MTTAVRRRRPAPCCEPVEVPRRRTGSPDRHPDGAARERVVLVGNPNVGKSTLFNALTGARQHVGNWPGKTVHVATGTWRVGGRAVDVVDLPGTYSLLPRSPDEQLTRDLLVDREMARRPDLAVVVVDAANLARNLYLLAQVLETGVPVVVALTMVDVATGRGVRVDAAALARSVRVPVVPVRPRKRRGMAELAAAVEASLARLAAPAARAAACGCAASGARPVDRQTVDLGGPVDPFPVDLGRRVDPSPVDLGHLVDPSPVDLGRPVESIVAELVAVIGAYPAIANHFPARWLALELLTDGPAAGCLDGIAGADRIVASVPALARRLTGTVRSGHSAGTPDPAAGGVPPGDADAETVVAERRYAWVHDVLRLAVRRDGALPSTLSDRVDRVLTSRRFGLPIFLLVMWAVFVATTRVAAPVQGGLQAMLDGPVRGGAGWLLYRAGASPGGFVARLVLDGMVAGVGQLLTFVPLMVIMFVLLAVLEDSGYLARAAFVVDRFMRLIGLPGRAFLPLVVGFGCNVPAIAGTRILSDSRQRLLTGLLVPYVTCSARLTVYVLLGNVFFGASAGTVVFAMYLLSVALVILIGLLLRHTLFRHHRREPLILELPPYRLPTLRVVSGQAWQKLAGFLRTASGIIMLTVVAVWLLSSIPAGGVGPDPAAAGGTGTPVGHSLYAASARALAPVFAPAGYGDWHATAALTTGFVAKEAVVSTFAQTYSASGPSPAGSGYGTGAAPGARRTGQLGRQLRATFAGTSGGHAPVAVLAFLVFLLAYTPCAATVAAQRHEIGTRWTLVGMGIQLSVAWLLSVLVFQLGRLLW